MKLFSRTNIDMTEGNLFKKIFTFAFPLMLTSLLQLLYTAADLMVIGQFRSTQAFSAISSTSSLINLCITLFVGLSAGSNVLMAKALGAKNNEDCKKVLHTSLLIAVSSGIVIGIVGFIFAKNLLEMMNSPYDVIELATLYLKIYFIGMPFNLLYNFGSAIMRANGDTSRPLVYLFISGAVNIIVNLFLVLVCNMSVDGVAIATILSQAISACLVLSALARYKEDWHFTLKSLSLDLKTLKGIILIGLPAGIQGTLFSISNVLIQSSVNSFGSFVMAGNGTASNLEGFVFVVMNAFYQATLSFIGQNLGAKKYYNIKKIYKYSIIYVIVFSFTLGLIVYSLSPILTKLYTSDPDVIILATNRIAIMCLSYFLCGIMDVTVGTLRGLGYSIIPMITSIIGVCGFRVLWVLGVFSENRNIGLLYASYPISWIITGSVLFICFLFIYKKIIKPLITMNNTPTNK